MFERAAASVVTVAAADDEAPRAVGSGFVWAVGEGPPSQALIVCNAHILAQQGSVTVRLGGVELSARVVGKSAAQDVAVLEANLPEGFLASALPLGSARRLRVGQAVYALGGGAGGVSMTCGLVSGLNRSIPSPALPANAITGCIQSDAAVQGGSSGGPLLNSAGQVVGLSTVSFTRLGTEGSSGLSFAVSSEALEAIVPSLIANKSARDD